MLRTMAKKRPSPFEVKIECSLSAKILATPMLVVPRQQVRPLVISAFKIICDAVRLVMHSTV